MEFSSLCTCTHQNNLGFLQLISHFQNATYLEKLQDSLKVTEIMVG